MPRIAAASIDEHVRQQTARITACAREVFARQGFRATDMGDIAAEVGLARNSLYRYFPNKDHMLLACIEEDMAPYLEWLDELPERVPEPSARVVAWVDAQFELATGPSHATMELMAEVSSAGAELMSRVAELHAAPNRALQQALVEFPSMKENASLHAAMIGSMVLAATRAAVGKKNSEQSTIKRELTRVVASLLK